MCQKLFRLSFVFFNELLTAWLPFSDVSRLDCACMADSSRVQYLIAVSNAALVVDCPNVRGERQLEMVLHWMNRRGVYIHNFKAPERVVEVFRTCVETVLFNSPCLRRLRHLDVSGCADLTSADFVKLMKNCPLLRTVQIGSGFHRCWLGDGAIHALTSSHLETLSMENVNSVTDTGIAAAVSGCSGLRCVRLTGCSTVGDATVGAIAKACPQLRSFTLTDNLCVTSNGLAVLMSSCEDMRELNVHRCRVRLPPVTASTTTQLRHFTYIGHLLCSDADLGAFLHACPLLTKLELRGISLTTAVEVLLGIPFLSNLTDLTISESPEVPPGLLQLLVGVTPRLQHLTLQNLPVNCEVMLCIVRSCGLLRGLDLSWCDSLNDLAVAALTDRCPQLERLVVKGCSKVTTAGLLRVLRRAAALCEVDVQYCPLVVGSELAGDMGRPVKITAQG
jgi:hypothetical protein